MKKLLLLIACVAMVVGCEKGGDSNTAGNAQIAIDAIFNKATAKDLVVAGELNQADWATLKAIKSQLPAVENITLLDASVIKSDVFAFTESSIWEQNRWLKKITAPKATIIEASALRYCINLVSANFESVETIEKNAFAGCESMTSVNTPQVKVIEAEAFAGCNAIVSLSFPHVLKVNSGTFTGCKTLTSIEFTKANVVSSDAFAACSSLQKLKFGSAEAIEFKLSEESRLETKNINLDITGVEAATAVGTIWKDKAWKSVSNNGAPVAEPDFGIANFGCAKEFVIKNETRRNVPGGVIYEGDNGSAWWYIYNFDANDRLVSGVIDYSFQGFAALI